MKNLVYVGIAMHPAAEEELRAKVEVTHDANRLGEAQGAIVYSPEEDWAERAETQKLRAIGCHAYGEKVGAWAKDRAIHMTEAKSLWHTVAEHTLALLMSAARFIPAADAAIRRGEWENHENLKVRYAGRDFQKRTLGIWGLGQIGLELASMLRGFDMRVIYNDLARNEQAERDYGITYVSKDVLFKESDFFVLLLPLAEETRGILGEAELKILKPGCVFVNTARAGIVEEKAFLDAVADGRIAAAALDVHWQEPVAKDYPLLQDERIVFSPHLGGSTYECDIALVDGVLVGLGE